MLDIFETGGANSLYSIKRTTSKDMFSFSLAVAGLNIMQEFNMRIGHIFNRLLKNLYSIKFK
ncbi:hypothetical protein FACS189491_00930 [Spirochaetia bacterium]|nr:hypothetical protein FACS189491_00930 [Spirochaetia bacterium]